MYKVKFVFISKETQAGLEYRKKTKSKRQIKFKQTEKD